MVYAEATGTAGYVVASFNRGVLTQDGFVHKSLAFQNDMDLGK